MSFEDEHGIGSLKKKKKQNKRQNKRRKKNK